MREESPGPGWVRGLDGTWYEAEAPAPQEADPNTNEAPAAWAGPSRPAGLGGEEPQTRFYAVATIIAPPILVGGFGLFGLAALSDPKGRPIGIVLTAVAVLVALLASRTPYVAIVRPDGSLTFKALIGSKETSVSRVSRMRLSTGARGASSWIFQFDGTSARLGDIGGKALARYVIDHNPSVEYPRGRFGL